MNQLKAISSFNKFLSIKINLLDHHLLVKRIDSNPPLNKNLDPASIAYLHHFKLKHLTNLLIYYPSRQGKIPYLLQELKKLALDIIIPNLI